ncbi:amylo-alpha-1,6-glucosidase [Dictyobacter kobayashii]|uniref:Glycogen debranching enzyme C-terminal domain-containing protein n=1 Tax=Dictyobacter kobayashii TaxID=2014872 RepID=A0A402AI46_9CHLR|nr:amylo-alpha-1,6-glucosidase [Dictyobacter kobayashii]GCE18769.1 hypothetical protein KDK_25690 [Dictyobacter kobayashii]
MRADKAIYNSYSTAVNTFIIHEPAATNLFEREKINRSISSRWEDQAKIVLISDYFAQEHRTRDALIAIPGLLLTTEQYAEAYQFLRSLADHFIGGILPDRLPTTRQALNDHSYSNADITLWYIYALNYYLQATDHYEFLEEIFPRLVESINRYKQGTHNGIRVDPTDGLLIAEKAGKALTWMNEYHEGHPITQRAGKPVEINALWYHALTLMQSWTERLEYIGHTSSSAVYYQQQASHCKHSFQQRFWNTEQGYLYDVIDGPEGNDATLRVNQLFALSLAHPILDATHRRQVFEIITQQLLTPYGLRSMAAQEPGYHAHIEIDPRAPQAYQQALHQGSCWVWLLGPYIDAMLNQCREAVAEQDNQLFQEYLWRKGMKLLEPLQERFSQGLLGMCENIFDGTSPQQAGPQSAAILSTAELLRTYNRLVRMRIDHPTRLLLL